MFNLAPHSAWVITHAYVGKFGTSIRECSAFSIMMCTKCSKSTGQIYPKTSFKSSWEYQKKTERVNGHHKMAVHFNRRNAYTLLSDGIDYPIHMYVVDFSLFSYSLQLQRNVFLILIRLEKSMPNNRSRANMERFLLVGINLWCCSKDISFN